MSPERRRQLNFTITYLILTVVSIWVLRATFLKEKPPREVAYSEFIALVDQGKVDKVQLRPNDIDATLKDPPNETIHAARLPGIDETSLVAEMRTHGATLTGKLEPTPWWQSVIGWLLPVGLMVAFYYFGVRRVSKSMGPLSVGARGAKIYDATQQDRVTFDDVAGVEEAKAELVEVVDFLQTPEKYRALGARIPKGVLLIGPPGTGKTLLARAVAGQAGVPFFSITGSAFVEMFVGLGAARIRQMFEQARERAPCIVFIDEIDAVGKSRAGMATLAVNDEREQTLNQLLAEMDGFDPSRGVILMAATNRPEILDKALLRAGRFDRQIMVDRPDVQGREQILKVHARRARIAPDVQFNVIAMRTIGMVGADLANVINEAALAAARRSAETVEMRDFEEAIDRIQLGLKKHARVMTPEEKRRVAYHESGHTLVALSVPHADPVHRVTIIPRGVAALGATLQLPTEDRYLVTRQELRDRICVMMGGRAAELLACHDMSSGAANDLELATEIARQMVCRFGMSDAIGPQLVGQPTSLMGAYGLPFGRDASMSEETLQTVDAEIRRILEDEARRASAIIERRRTALERIVERLMVEETLERAAIEALVREAGANGNASDIDDLEGDGHHVQA